MVSIVKILKEFREILLGQKFRIHGDHNNLTCENFNTNNVPQWRIMLEECARILRIL